jgi:7tm Odorant receptor
MSVLKTYEQLLRFCSRNMWICGVEVLDDNFKWFNIRFVFVCLLILAYFINSTYTCATNNLEVSLQWLSTFSFTVQGIPKLWVVINKRWDLVDTTNEMVELIKQGLLRGANTRFYQKLEKCGRMLQIVYWGYVGFIVGGVSICLAYPVLMYFVDGGLHLMVPLYIPYVDRFTVSGYTTTMIYHLVAVTILLNFTLALDFLFFSAVASYAMQVELMCEINQELNTFLLFDEAIHNQVGWKTKVNGSLSGIIRKHQNIQRMMERLNDLFFWPITCQMATAVLSLSVSLFLMMTVSFFS